MTAVYLGPRASFSHQAAIEIFRDRAIQIEAVPSFADVFEGIQSSRYDYGVVPFENSSNGSVVQVLDLLADRQSNYSAVNVCAEHYLPVHHQLLVKLSDSDARHRPDLGETLKFVKKFYTHPHVWGQCSSFLSRPECRTVARQDSSSTSEAAMVVSENEANAFAAISSELAAKEYGLVNVAANIEDQGDNSTRFFILARAGIHLSQSPSQRINDAGYPQLTKSMVSFTIEHGSPGALADALSIFKKHDFNLTSINTRPSRQRPWNYIFFTECEQTRQQRGPDAVGSLLSDLGEVVLSCRHLGSWPDQWKPS